jgi:Fe2+ transport system protein FeoA
VQDLELEVGNRGAPVVLRQIMAQAVAVPGGKIRAAQVRLGEQSIALREGLAETVGDTRLLYREEPMLPEARYHVSAINPDGATIETFTITSGEERRMGSWVLALSPENPFAPRGVALTAERRPGGLSQVVGLTLFVSGSFGLVVVRFASKP